MRSIGSRLVPHLSIHRDTHNFTIILVLITLFDLLCLSPCLLFALLPSCERIARMLRPRSRLCAHKCSSLKSINIRVFFSLLLFKHFTDISCQFEHLRLRDLFELSWRRPNFNLTLKILASLLFVSIRLLDCLQVVGWICEWIKMNQYRNWNL